MSIGALAKAFPADLVDAIVQATSTARCGAGAMLGIGVSTAIGDAWQTLRLAAQADREGLDLFTVSDPRTSATGWTPIPS